MSDLQIKTEPVFAGFGLNVLAVDRVAHESHLAELDSFLTPLEKARSQRFATEYLQTRYVLGRGILRSLLADRLSIGAADVVFEIEQNGKPKLAGSDSNHLSFNMTDSGEEILVVFGDGRQVGIDLEMPGRKTNFDMLKRKLLQPAERDVLDTYEGEDRREVFLRYWTRKECLMKCTGEGLKRSAGRIPINTEMPDQDNLPGAPLGNHDLGDWPVTFDLYDISSAKRHATIGCAAI